MVPVPPNEEKAPENEVLSTFRSNNRRENFWKWTIVVVYGLVVLAIVPVHEPWRDEAHTWLIARDLSVPGILRQLHYEGYPPLWFLMQAPLAKAGLPVASLGVLNAICATLAVAIMVFYSPFTLWQKALIAFSDGLFCWIGMIWRCYSLLALALFLVAAIYPYRHRRPIFFAFCVILLANAHILSMGVALLFLLGFIVGLAKQYFGKSALQNPEQISVPANLLACMIMTAGLAVLVLLLRQPPDCRNPGMFPIFRPQAAPDLLTGGFIRTLFSPDNCPHKAPLYVIGIGAFALVLFDLRKSRDAFWLLLLTFLGWSYVFTFKNKGPGWQHFPVMTLMMVAACWIARAAGFAGQSGWFELRWQLPLREALVFASLLFGLFYVPHWIYMEVRYPFSMGKGAAQVLRNIGFDQQIAAWPLARAESLLPYLPGRKVWSFEMNSFETFHTPCRQYDAFPVLAVLNVSMPRFEGKLPWLISTYQMRNSPYYEEAYPLTAPLAWHMTQENFYVYRPKEITNSPTDGRQ